MSAAPDLAGRDEIPYTVRRSTRARRVRVNVHAHTGVEVVLPARAPERAAAAAVSELRPWIERRLAEAREALAHVAAPRRHAALPRRDARRSSRSRGARACTVAASGCSCPRAMRGRRSSASTGAPARVEIAPRLDRATARAGLAYSGLDIRAQRTRWASCSSRGRMSFNWRLLLAPERVLDYVVWHEVCHLEVLDHSPRFWALLEPALAGLPRGPRVAAAPTARRS